jgi:micrococcal nuclease
VISGHQLGFPGRAARADRPGPDHPTLFPMRITLVLVLALLAACAAPRDPGAPVPGQLWQDGQPTACAIVKVTDGDTVRVRCASGYETPLRLMGYDTPETFRPGCWQEEVLGKRATAWLRTRLRAARRIEVIEIAGSDRYDRVLVRLAVDGQDVGAGLIAAGLAAPYDGGRRIDWCARLGV